MLRSSPVHLKVVVNNCKNFVFETLKNTNGPNKTPKHMTNNRYTVCRVRTVGPFFQQGKLSSIVSFDVQEEFDIEGET